MFSNRSTTDWTLPQNRRVTLQNLVLVLVLLRFCGCTNSLTFSQTSCIKVVLSPCPSDISAIRAFPLARHFSRCKFFNGNRLNQTTATFCRSCIFFSRSIYSPDQHLNNGTACRRCTQSAFRMARFTFFSSST